MEPINLSEYETLAQARLEAAVWDYYQGGSEDEVTLRANHTAFERIRLRPRMLVDVSTCDLRTTVLGTPVSMPILVAPTAYHCMAHPDGECATVQGAGKSRTLFTASTAATRTLEDIAQAASGPLWFQLYLNANLRISEALVRRAEAAGYRAIVLTVDLPRLGNRERDKRYNVIMPPEPWREANFVQEYPEEAPEDRESLFEVMKSGWDSSNLTWGILGWLRSVTSLPIMLKGILTAEDAALAVAHNVAGIVVSNHGGRQLDGALASIEALPEVVEAVAGRCEVYLDGGIRRGSDVLKALALGARAVLVGRPALWGLAVNGADGVHDVLEILRTELDRAMALSGRPTIASIDRSLVRFV
ncbi:MAG: alpha-hydroxy-acid oxidizing protein [Ktedonobacteraceae bacterium]|nr:alpha-hydroxy-acid oxidizing protein [Ktedonobacteraceae bacterium]